ncbi:protein ALP1-like [Lactuca sativa]|uniref:protein ALP1-like n=1 Tax=Lactuca sativa TaxID=4236 RepID=UPI000CD815B8|nr:protein ALP1-like [Lactuca sativa]
MLFFCSPGSLNDINVLNRSPIFNNIYDGSVLDSSFQLRGTPYKYVYHLVDEIYPEYAVFVKSFTCPKDARQKKFKKAQERATNDVESAFGALKKRWFILKKPVIFFSEEKMHEVMYACVILYNMIIENEGRAICEYDEEKTIPATQGIEIRGDEYIEKRAEVRCNETFHNLRMNLVEHIYRMQHIDLNLDPEKDPKDEFSEDNFM